MEYRYAGTMRGRFYYELDMQELQEHAITIYLGS